MDIKKTQKTCWRLQVLDISMFATALKHLISRPYIPPSHVLLKSRIKEFIQRCLSKKNGEQRYRYLVIGRDKSCFVKSHSKLINKYKHDEIIQMLDFLIVVDNIFVLFGRRVFQQKIGFPMGTNCALLLTHLFLHAYDADFLQGLSRIKIEN
jgi:hypothetical protein